MQAFCSSITGALATLAILKGVGVGDSSATPLAATITWMFKGLVAMTPGGCNARYCRWCRHVGAHLLWVDGGVSLSYHHVDDA